jgi:hypothetical protein
VPSVSVFAVYHFGAYPWQEQHEWVVFFTSSFQSSPDPAAALSSSELLSLFMRFVLDLCESSRRRLFDFESIPLPFFGALVSRLGIASAD